MRTGFYGAVRGDGSPYIVGGKLDDLLIQHTARFSDVALDLGCIEQHPEIRNALRAANPKMTLHAYVVMRWWGVDQYSPAFFREFNRIVHATNGICWGTDGQPWGVSNVNLAQPETVRQLAAIITQYAEPWDAVFLDILVPIMPVGQTDIDYQRSGYPTMSKFAEAWNAGALALRDLIPKSVSANYGGVQPPSYNGPVFENFPYLPPWANGWEGVMKLAREHSYAEPRTIWIVGNYHSLDPLDPVNHQRARFYHGSALLVDGAIGGFGRYENKDWNPGWVEAHPSMWWKDFELEIGTPESPAFHLIDSNLKRVDLWVRNYSKGVVVVNPSQRAHSIYFARRYRPANGAVKDSFSIPAGDALIAEVV